MNLKRGSRYYGKQKSGSSSFSIVMKIDNVDLNNKLICGIFNICNRTGLDSKISTYFEAVIFENISSFSQDIENDKICWDTFPVHRNNSNILECCFLKIKELFIISEPKRETTNVSIDGFYYCCYYKKHDSFSGQYFYKNGTETISEFLILERVKETTSTVSYLT